ncbi:MAG: hypothetical protein H0M93_00980 [Methanophagales archaeon]|nr:hypothetical protein [Methanophagales archaeon]
MLNALSNNFDLGLRFEYIDSSSIAKEKLPDLKNFKLKTVVKHFGLSAFRHHDATEDAIACAKIFLKLREHGEEETLQTLGDESAEFKGMVMSILADDEVNYKEAYELLYWLEDHVKVAKKHPNIYLKTKEVLDDDHLDRYEAKEMKAILNNVLRNIE